MAGVGVTHNLLKKSKKSIKKKKSHKNKSSRLPEKWGHLILTHVYFIFGSVNCKKGK